MVNTSNLRIGLRLLYNQSWLGGVNYVLSIGRMLRALPEHERPEITFLTAGKEAEAIAFQHKNIADHIAPIEETRELNLDFVYPATQLAEASFGTAWAGWIPDWQCQYFPELFPPPERVRRYVQYRALASLPVSCLFSSQQAIDDTKTLFGESPETTEWCVFHFPAVFDEYVWALGSDSTDATRKKYALPKKYLIICNQFWRHKNHLVVLEALKKIPEADVHLALTGEMKDTRWPDYMDDLREALEHPDVKNRITLTGRIERDDQLKLLLGSSGYVQPSRFEGWSTFVEEARAIGLPGLLSDIPVHREQAPEGAIFFNPDDSDELARKISEFASDPPAKIELESARFAHSEYVLNAARVFLKAARDARARYVPETHDAGVVMLRTSETVSSETIEFEQSLTDGSSDTEIYEIGPTREDYDRFFAGLRHLLRQLPEELARLSFRIASKPSSLKKELETQLVQATLQKMDEASRTRFHEFHERQDLETKEETVGSAITMSKKRHGSFIAKIRVFVGRIIERAWNFARRKFT